MSTTSLHDNDSPRRSRSSSASRRKNRLSNALKTQSNVPVLSADYLSRHTSKNDLVRRLRKVVDALSDEDVECNSPEYPGLARLASDLVKDRYLQHKDKEVRLYTVMACMEIFRVYVPEPPYDESEILKIFPQLIQQLANLANCTSPTQPNFAQYFKLLEELANYKIGVVLVEMTKMLDPESEYGGADIHINEEHASHHHNHHHLHHSRDKDSPSSEDALEVLRELIEVLLNSIQIDHPSEVTTLAISAISACIEEFYGTVPIPILDEILKCVGAGPVVWVTNPAFVEASAALAASKKKDKKIEKKKLPPVQIQQTNQSYIVACGVIKKTIDRISTPTASLLNGILNSDNNVMKFSNIASSEEPMIAEKGTIVAAAGCIPEKVQPNADVWSIVYELHKISPHILTTVIGTVAASLQSPEEDKRLRVTKLLGRLFYSKASDIGVNFHACYKEWTRRSMDMSVKIRETMVKCLLEILRNKSNCESLCIEASEVLVKMLTSDPSLDVRLSCIHKVCDLAYSINDGKDVKNHAKPMVPVPLLKAIGNRVSSKNKKERLDSVTGLAKIYHRHYVLPKLKVVQDGGDDCNIDIILDTLHNNCDLKIYKIGKKSKRGSRKSSSSPVFSPVRKHFAASDMEMDEKYKFISKKVFNCAFFTDVTDPNMRNRVLMIVDDVLLGTGTSALKDKSSSCKQILTPTSRSIGLSIIVNHLLTSDDNDDESDTNDNGASYKWMCSLLAQRAKLQHAVKAYIDLKSKAEQHPNGSEERDNMNAEAFEKLKHVASLSSPVSAIVSPGTSVDSLDSILNKVHTARDKHIFRLLASISSPNHSLTARSRALEDLPKRTKSLGSSASSWIKHLARRCAMGHFVNVETITHCILLAQEALHAKDLQVCMALLECVKVAVNIYPSLGSTEEGYETLIELFAECRGQKGEDLKGVKDCGILTILSGILAVVTPTRTSPSKNLKKESPACEDELKSELYRLCTKDGTPEQAKNAIVTMAALVEKQNIDQDSQMKEFTPLLKALTASSSMCLSVDGVDNEKIVNVMKTLTAMVESVPALFMGTSDKDNGYRAIQFALNEIILGKSEQEEKENDENSANGKAGTPARRKSARRKDSKVLSLACQRTIAAIEFLVSHIRSTILYSRKSGKHQSKPAREFPSDEHISAVFEVLVNLIRDGGYLPSCQSQYVKDINKERSSLRKSAALSLLKLCDGSLNIESKFFSSKYWLIFSRAFVDENYEVRDSIMNELSMMLIGGGAYCQGNLGFLPSLRFLACITLCPDDDHHSYIGGAKVGKRSIATKNAAEKCVTSLRRTSEDTLLQCRAISKKAELNFENNLKMKLMPEFAVPYAFHLLSFRPETPSDGFAKRMSSDTLEADHDGVSKEELSHKLLRKRLRWLLEPLVQSLGEGADNISFLLRMTELLGQRYRPIDVVNSNNNTSKSSNTSFPDSPFSDLSLGEGDNSIMKENDDLSQAKLKVICTEARELLLKFVKKDKNLDPYPGVIQIPSFLYKRSSKVTRGSPTQTAELSKSSSAPSTGSSMKKRKVGGFDKESDQNMSVDNSGGTNLSINLSPIAQSHSPLRILSTKSQGDDDDGDSNHDDVNVDDLASMTKTPQSEKKTATTKKRTVNKKVQKFKKAHVPAVGLRRSRRLSGD